MDELFMHLAACCRGQKSLAEDCDNRLTAADRLTAGLQQLQLGTQAADSLVNTGPNVHSTRSRLHAAWPDQEYRIFAFDLETTGFNHAYDAIIEMAVVDVASDAHWSSLIRPEPWKRSHPEALAAHGITDDMLRQPDLPTISQAWSDVLNFIVQHTPPRAKPMLVAHNGFAFDFRMLCCCLIRQQQQQQCTGSAAADDGSCSSSGGSSSKWWWLPDGLLALDGLQIARSLKLKDLARLENLKQATVVQHFLGAPPEVSHRALADTQQLAKLLPHLFEWAARQVGASLDERLVPRKLTTFAAAAADKLLLARNGTTPAAAAAAAAARSNAAEEASFEQQGSKCSYAAAADTAAAEAAGLAVRRTAGRGRGRISSRRNTKSLLTAAISDHNGSSSITRSKPGCGATVVAAAAVAAPPAETLETLEPAADQAEFAAAAAAAVKSSSRGSRGRGRGRSRAQRPVCEPAQGSSSNVGVPSVLPTITSTTTAAPEAECTAEYIAASAEAAEGDAIHVFAAPAISNSSNSNRGKGRGGGRAQWAVASSQSSSMTAAAAACAAAAGNAVGNLAEQAVGNLAEQAVGNLAEQVADLDSSSSPGSNNMWTPSALPQDAFAGHQIVVRGRLAPVLSAAAFVQLVKASLHCAATGGSSSSSGGTTSRDLLHLGPSTPGKNGSAFYNVLLGPANLPVVFLLEGVAVSKELRMKYSDGGSSVVGVKLLLKDATGQQQQRVKQVAAAVDELTALLHNVLKSPADCHPEQQQQQRVFSCLSGTSLQVRLPCSNSNSQPRLETVIMQSAAAAHYTHNIAVGSSSSSRDGAGRHNNNSNKCNESGLLTVGRLQSPAAATALQDLLPVGSRASVLLCPSSVWVNSQCVGVMLNCLQVLKM